MFQALLFVQAFLFLFLSKFSNFFKRFSRSYCVLRYNLAFACARMQYFRRISLVFKARRGRKMTLQKAKPSRILHFCINFFQISRQYKNLINGRSGSEIGHPKAPWGPPFMLPRRPPGDLFFHLSKFMLLRRFSRHDETLLVLSWRPSEPSCRPPGGSFGGLLGASRGCSATPQGPDDGIPSKNLRSFTSWPSCQHLLHFLL